MTWDVPQTWLLVSFPGMLARMVPRENEQGFREAESAHVCDLAEGHLWKEMFTDLFTPQQMGKNRWEGGKWGNRGFGVSHVQHAEKAMAPHSSILAWKIPWAEEPGRLQSMGSLRVGHDWATSLSLFTFMHWRRKWQPTPVFFPGESQGQGTLVGCCLWGHTESDTTEAT